MAFAWIKPVSWLEYWEPFAAARGLWNRISWLLLEGIRRGNCILESPILRQEEYHSWQTLGILVLMRTEQQLFSLRSERNVPRSQKFPKLIQSMLSSSLQHRFTIVYQPSHHWSNQPHLTSRLHLSCRRSPEQEFLQSRNQMYCSRMPLWWKDALISDLYQDGQGTFPTFPLFSLLPNLTSYLESLRVILSTARGGLVVVGIFCGHPGMLYYPSQRAVDTAKHKGYQAATLPRTSAQDALLADLGIDFAIQGYHTYQAIDFLLQERPIVVDSQLTLCRKAVLDCISGLIRVRESLTSLNMEFRW